MCRAEHVPGTEGRPLWALAVYQPGGVPESFSSAQHPPGQPSGAMQWCPLGALGGPSLPSVNPQGNFQGTFPGWQNSGSWMGVQVGVAVKEPKAPQAHVFSLICRVNLSCVWMGVVYMSGVRSLLSRNGLSCGTHGSRSHSRSSSGCPWSGGPGSGLLAPGHMVTVSLQSPLSFKLPKDKDYLTF